MVPLAIVERDNGQCMGLALFSALHHSSQPMAARPAEFGEH
jgi:hypothetical protein